MYWYNHNGMGLWGFLVMTLVLLLLAGLVVAAVVALFHSTSRTEPTGSPPTEHGVPGQGASPTPEQVLAARFARGEIDEDEYRRRLETLRTVGRT